MTKTKMFFMSAAAGVLALSSVGAMSASTVLAAGDAVRGKKVAKKCKVCHTMKKGGVNKLGPNLFDILNQPAASVKGYRYSKALKKSGIIWDESTFTDFVAKPKSVVKGTKMSFRGIRKATQRADLLAYFKTLGTGGKAPTVSGDAIAGKRVATKLCAVCHSFNKGGKVVFGPNLFDIAGKPAAAIKGFRYSKALKASGLTWTDHNLTGFLADPENFVKGTTARFPGLKSAKQKADVLAYIKTLK